MSKITCLKHQKTKHFFGLSRWPHVVLSPPTQWLWREFPALGSWDSPSQRTCPRQWGLRPSNTFLRRPRRTNHSQKLLVNFYKCTTESILINCITVWYSTCTNADKKALQRIVKTAQGVVGIYHSNIFTAHSCVWRAKNITENIIHPGHHLFKFLPSGRHFKSIHMQANIHKAASSQKLGHCWTQTDWHATIIGIHAIFTYKSFQATDCVIMLIFYTNHTSFNSPVHQHSICVHGIIAADVFVPRLLVLFILCIYVTVVFPDI